MHLRPKALDVQPASNAYDLHHWFVSSGCAAGPKAAIENAFIIIDQHRHHMLAQHFISMFELHRFVTCNMENRIGTDAETHIRIAAMEVANVQATQTSILQSLTTLHLKHIH